jgi:cobalt/nickel transport system permease protein
MLIDEIYNYRHRLAHVSLGIRTSLIVPTFILVLISHSAIFNVCVFIVILALIKFVTQITVSKLIKLFKYPILFLLTGCITIALSFHSTAPFFYIKGAAFGIDKANIALAQLVFFRSLTLLSLVYFYLLSHTISEIAEVMHCCKAPKLFIELFVLSYKFIFNLLAAGKSMYTAQNCRLAYSYKGKNIAAFTLLIAAVFRKAMLQASQLEITLASRLGNHNLNFVGPQRHFHKKQIIAPLLLFFAMLVLFIIL